MPYRRQLSVDANYLHAVIGGLEHRTDAEEAWAEIRKAIDRHKMHGVLAEIQIQHSIPTAELYKFGQVISGLNWPGGISIAVVFDEPYAADFRFTETVIANRCGLRSRGFVNRQEAIDWLKAADA